MISHIKIFVLPNKLLPYPTCCLAHLGRTPLAVLVIYNLSSHALTQNAVPSEILNEMICRTHVRENARSSREQGHSEICRWMIEGEVGIQEGRISRPT